jgi:hypothetical protein
LSKFAVRVNLPFEQSFIMAVALLQAVEDCRYTQARLLIEQGVNINSRNSAGCTPLIMALTIPDDNKRYKMFRWLLRMGADSGYVDITHGRDLLTWAAFYDRTEQVRGLLDVDDGLVNAHHQDRDGRTAMHYATMRGNVDALFFIVRYAVKYGLSVDVRDKDGLTPYLIATMTGQRECRRILVEVGRAVTSQMVLAIQMPTINETPASTNNTNKSSRFEQNLQQKSFLPPLKQNLESQRQQDSSDSSATSSPFSASSPSSPSSPFLTRKRRNIPRLMDILSQQASLTYRPSARVPVITPPKDAPAPPAPAPAPEPAPKASEKPVLSLQTAVRISTLAVNFRKRRQNKS